MCSDLSLKAADQCSCASLGSHLCISSNLESPIKHPEAPLVEGVTIERVRRSFFVFFHCTIINI